MIEWIDEKRFAMVSKAILNLCNPDTCQATQQLNNATDYKSMQEII